MIWMWPSKLFFRVNVFWQILQVNGFKFSWMNWICSVKVFFRLNVFWQILHVGKNILLNRFSHLIMNPLNVPSQTTFLCKCLLANIARIWNKFYIHVLNMLSQFKFFLFISFFTQCRKLNWLFSYMINIVVNQIC